MKTLRTRLILVAFCAPLAIACGGSDEDTGTENSNVDQEPNEPPLETGACTGDEAIPCVPVHAEPCEGINSGYPGDEYCRAAPDAEKGMQLHVGPSDYDDPEDVESYLIHPGEETNWAEIQQTDNDESVFTSGYYSYMRPGSHHFILFRLNEQVASGRQETEGGTESAVGALNGEFLAGATRAIQNAVLNSDLPEDQGIGNEMPPHQSIAVNLHFINTQNEPLIQEIWVNFRRIAREDVQHWAKPITWYGGLGMNIPPATHTTLTNRGTECTAPGDIRISGMTGHVHANTLRYNATMQRAGETTETILFEDYDWHEPTEFRFSRAIDNPAPDAASKTSGGYSGVVTAKAGDQFYWECEIFNQTDVNLTFSNKVYDGEMCNVFGFYTMETNTGGPWLCAFF